MRSLLLLLACLALVAARISNPRRNKSKGKKETDSGDNYVITEEAWFEVQVDNLDGRGKDFKGNFTVGLFGKVAPMTVLNFVAITRGYKKGRDFLAYKNSIVHRIVKDFLIQMGDITRADGKGGKSIFGDRFNDETFELKHRSAGWVAMANHGADTNGSQFYITLNKTPWLDNKHVIFGKVIKGWDTIEKLSDVPVDVKTNWPMRKTSITRCGINDLQNDYTLSPNQLDNPIDQPAY